MTLTKKAQKEQEREESRQTLLSWLKPGDKVYTVLRHVSRSGMSRRIDLYAFVMDDKGEPCKVWLSWHAARVMGYRLGGRSGDDGIVTGGCGMDMGFHLVYTLGRYLWPDGTPEPHGRRNGEPDSDGGYALRQEWI